MKKSEKILSALALVALGVLFIILKADFIGILMTVIGVCLVAFGIVDCFQRDFPQAVVKIVSGILIVVAGWAIVEAVLYILSALLLIFGILWVYDIIKKRSRCATAWQTFLLYAQPIICITIGVLLLFHRGEFIDFILVLSGILTMIEGGVLLVDALTED